MNNETKKRRGRPNNTGIDWSDPDAVAAYKRSNEQHHEYNREYMREHRAPAPLPHQPTQFPGEDSSNHVLTWERVREIRKRYAAGGIGYARLAREYGVSPSTIVLVVKRETWIEED